MPRPKVHSVAIELTPLCNQRCHHCYNSFRQDGGARLAVPDGPTLLARVDKLLEQLDVEHFTLTGGEPFAHRDVFQVIERIRRAGAGVQLISNGGLIDDAVASRLASLEVDTVQLTLNGPDARLHAEHVGSEHHFEGTLAGLRALQRHRVPVAGCIVVTRKNALRTAEILSLFRSLGVGRVALSRFSPTGYAAAQVSQLLCTRDQLTSALEQAVRFAREGMHLAVTMPVPPCAVEVERFPELHFGACAIGTPMQEFALGPDGSLRNCTLHATALGGVGDILDPLVNLAELVGAKEVSAYKQRVPEFCAGCLHEQTCAGGCGAAAASISGDARAFPDPFVWQHLDDALGTRLEQARNASRQPMETPT